MQFNEVVTVLKEEREYQDKVWKGEPHSVCDFMVYMQDYLTQAMHDATRNPGDQPALDTLRKVVTLGVACFEQHGVPRRK